MVELLGSYTEDNASQARVDAHRYTNVLLLSFVAVLILSTYSIYMCLPHLQVYCPCSERPQHLPDGPPPDTETCPFPGGRTHP